MLLKSLKYILATIFFLFSFVLAFSADLIIPKKKPSLQSGDIVKKISSNFIIPQEKPIDKKKIIIKDEEKISEKRITKIDGIIIPKSKPLIVKKERLRKVKTSRYYSDRDLKFAKQAIAFMEKSNWKDAKKVAKKARFLSKQNFKIRFNL